MSMRMGWQFAPRVLAVGLLSLPAQARWARKPDMPIRSSTAYLVQNFSAEDGNASNFAPPEDVARPDHRQYIDYQFEAVRELLTH
jgi:hypothetical protein